MTEVTKDPTQDPGTAKGDTPGDKAEAAPLRKRIPMSTSRRKLSVPALPGYHLHWFLERNVPAAQQAYYEFVKSSEVNVNQFNPGQDSLKSGNSDLGNQVRVFAGTSEHNSPEYFYLMKLKEIYWNEDQAELQRRNAAIMEAVFEKEQILGSEDVQPGDRDQRYVKTELTSIKTGGVVPLFNRPIRKA